MKINKYFLLTALLQSFLFLFVSCMNNLGEATKTTKNLDEDLYYMELEGDDGIPELLNRGGSKSTDELADYITEFLGKGPFKRSVSINPSDIACTTFIAPDGKGGFVVGRNYDWDSCTALILRNKPDYGYESISTVNLEYLGFEEGFTPNNMINEIKALAGIYVPLDGINEKGLVVADLMAGDKEGADQNTDKPDLTTTCAIRVLLNYADSVDAAIELLNQYDIHAEIASAHHLFIADKTGKAVDVEWVNDVMTVTETTILTNHYLCEQKYGIGSENSKLRFGHVSDALKSCNGITDESKAKDILERVKATNYSDYDMTQWSIVYSLNNELKEAFYWRSDFSTSFDYSFN